MFFSKGEQKQSKNTIEFDNAYTLFKTLFNSQEISCDELIVAKMSHIKSSQKLVTDVGVD